LQAWSGGRLKRCRSENVNPEVAELGQVTG
jgi:hypothetical protein